MTLADDFVSVRFDLEGDGWVYYLGSTHQQIIEHVDSNARRNGWSYLKATNLTKEETMKAISHWSLEPALSKIISSQDCVQSDMSFPREMKK